MWGILIVKLKVNSLFEILDQKVNVSLFLNANTHTHTQKNKKQKKTDELLKYSHFVAKLVPS